MPDPDELLIKTSINKLYQIFDRSGCLPFSIVFGLCRWNDTDPRALRLNVARTALDVPYALKHGLISLHNDTDGEAVDLSTLADSEPGSQHDRQITLSSPVNRERTLFKFDTYLVYHYNVDIESQLATLLETGNRYSMRLEGNYLGETQHAFVTSETHSLEEADGIKQPSSTTKLISKANGWARFQVVPSLPQPPSLTTRMRLVSSDETPGAPLLELTITNTSTQPVNVQTRGRQRYLEPWGPFQPTSPPHEESMGRILDPSDGPLLATLQIFDASTGINVRPARKPATCILSSGNADHRPKIANLVTLAPGEPVVKRVDIAALLLKLPDGRYEIRLHPRNAWWCVGAREEIQEEGGDRVQRRLHTPWIPPLRLGTEDVVGLHVEDGKWVGF